MILPQLEEDRHGALAGNPPDHIITL